MHITTTQIRFPLQNMIRLIGGRVSVLSVLNLNLLILLLGILIISLILVIG